MRSTNKLYQAVNAYATDNYDQGWDVVVECMSEDEIEAIVAGCNTSDEAIAAVAKECGLDTERVTGYVITIKACDGTSRKSFPSFNLAIEYFKDMAGWVPANCSDERVLANECFNSVTDHGSVVSLNYAQ